MRMRLDDLDHGTAMRTGAMNRTASPLDPGAGRTRPAAGSIEGEVPTVDASFAMLRRRKPRAISSTPKVIA